MKISKLFEGTCPAGLPLEASPIRTERVLDLVRAGVQAEKRPRRLGGTVRTVLIAAALTLALSVTAWAVYMARVEDYVIDQPLVPPPPVAETDEAESVADTRQRLSLTGYQGTPEYEAYTQWEAWKNQWMEENWDRWAEMGVDDSYHETADNYVLYDACFQDQADKLDEIAAEHGLTLHSQWTWFKDAQELYDTLDVQDLGLAGGSGYIYDDGSFKLECSAVPGLDGVEVTVVVSAKGSFSMISSSIGGDYEEWESETADGAVLDLALEPERGVILCETEGAYIYVDASRTVEREDGAWEQTLTKEELETVAGAIRFDLLAERFDGKKDGAITEAVAALAERRQQEQQELQAAAEEMSADMEDVLADLGRYAPGALPDQFTDLLRAGACAADAVVGMDGTVLFGAGTFFPGAEQADMLTYYRLRDPSAPAGEYVAAIRDWLAGKYPDGEITDETVQGMDAVMVFLPDHGAVYWYDAQADLIFEMGVDSFDAGRTVDRTEVLDLAESVEKAE